MPKTKAESKNDSEPQSAKVEEEPLATKKGFDELRESPDFEKFLTMKSLAGEYSASDQLSEDEKEKIVSEFQRWIQAGKPNPTMPKLSEISVPVITSLYRIKVGGKQKIYAYKSGGAPTLGIKETVMYSKRIDQNTGQEITTNEPTGEVRKEYTLDYTKKLGEELVDEAIRTNENIDKIGFYVLDGKQKFYVDSADFNMDYDSLVRKYRQMQQVSLK